MSILVVYLSGMSLGLGLAGVIVTLTLIKNTKKK